MREIDLKELKKIELNLLKEFKKICEKQGFRYSLGGGTLLGAVRHKGFIPWDDDIDVNMPRPDYEKLINYCKKAKNIPFILVCNELEPSYGNPFAKIVDQNTILKDESNLNNSLVTGVNIDIFPIDGLGMDLEEAKINFYKSSIQRELLVARNWKRYFRSKTHSILIEPFRFVFYLFSRGLSVRKLNLNIKKLYANFDFDSSNYSAVVCGDKRIKEIQPTNVFNEFIDLTFEGELFKCFKKFDFYLSSNYGDYMKLPPENVRVSHHMFKAYYKD